MNKCSFRCHTKFISGSPFRIPHFWSPFFGPAFLVPLFGCPLVSPPFLSIQNELFARSMIIWNIISRIFQTVSKQKSCDTRRTRSQCSEYIFSSIFFIGFVLVCSFDKIKISRISAHFGTFIHVSAHF